MDGFLMMEVIGELMSGLVGLLNLAHMEGHYLMKTIILLDNYMEENLLVGTPSTIIMVNFLNHGIWA